MDTRRVLLYAVLVFLGYSLYTSWQKDYPVVPSSNALSSQTIHLENPDSTTNEGDLLPQVATSDPLTASTSNATVTSEESRPAATSVIRVKTDVLNIAIDPKQGDIVGAQLIDYPAAIDKKTEPFTLLQDQTTQRYVANSRLLISNGQKLEPTAVNFTTPSSIYTLDEQAKELIVTLSGKTEEGLAVRKEFHFKRGSYLIGVRYVLNNENLQPWIGYFGTQLVRHAPPEDKASIFHVGSYTGASYSVPGQHRYQKLSFDAMHKTNLDTQSSGGWIAMQQHYFLTAWVPPQNSQNLFYSRTLNNNYTIGTMTPAITVKPGEKETVGADLYVGPEITKDLKAIAPGLDLTVDYGILWFLSAWLFSLMKGLYSFIGNWGWVIVLVTLLIKLAFYQLSAKSYRSMAGMRRVQPKLQMLKERYGDDKAKLSQATMELYRQEKINPLGGCLPILVQIPVFFALYWVLLESVELRQAPFIFWINDLSSPDMYHVLPIIMGGTMLVQQKLNPAPPDPMQAKIMMFLPILFTGLFWNFPAGLVLYWIVNNTLSILQQWYITRKYGEKSVQKK
ncbi:MAG: membrane protein insertase YidC [Legionella sp.]|nr:membrane protein insertase YidC [Legionella sp.]